ALNGIDMEVGRGEMIAIMGPSGCGKTTLLNCLSGLDSINSGNIFVDQQPIHDLSDDKMSEFRAKSMGFIFQTYNLLPVLTARENVEMPLLISGISSKEAANQANEQLEAVGLLEWSTHKPGELSGGQRQRVAIARALVNKPAIVWADEPTGNLDSNNENEIMELLSFTNSQYNQTIVLVTHSDKVAAKADRIVRMEDGIIVNSG
ncbi:MAG: ABC transporter ATP-binding protein, partial [SAR202 cluster bacterium]|nr:ABC transporter ATP-binding protein [SAR202 cluster bacterium]